MRFWSVTTLIKNGTPADALIHWAANTVAEGAVANFDAWKGMVAAGDTEGAINYLRDLRFRKQGQALARGSQVHRIAEALNLGTPVPQADAEAMPFVEQYQRFLAEHRPQFLAAEAPVYNLTYRYAGTLDSIAEVGGATVVLDVKTHVKELDARSRPPYPDVALQLAAYARAELLGLHVAAEKGESAGKRYYVYDSEAQYAVMPPVQGALALAISPWDYTLTAVDIGDRVWDAFMAVRDVARWSLDTSRTVLGPQVTPKYTTPQEATQ